MGCDIHYVVERKFNNTWVGVYAKYETPSFLTRREDGPAGDWSARYKRAPVFSERNYGFFNLLAGVRGGSGVVPVGLPDDMSELANVISTEDGSDGHSHSWLSYREWCHRYALASGRALTENDRLDWIAGCDDEDFDNYRVVFWFDN